MSIVDNNVQCKGKRGMTSQPCPDQPLNSDGYCKGHEESMKLSKDNIDKMKIRDYKLVDFEIDYLEATKIYLQKWAESNVKSLAERLKNMDDDLIGETNLLNLKSLDIPKETNVSMPHDSNLSFEEVAWVEFEKFIKDRSIDKTNPIKVSPINRQRIWMYASILDRLYNNLGIPR